MLRREWLLQNSISKLRRIFFSGITTSKTKYPSLQTIDRYLFSGVFLILSLISSADQANYTFHFMYQFPALTSNNLVGISFTVTITLTLHSELNPQCPDPLCAAVSEKPARNCWLEEDAVRGFAPIFRLPAAVAVKQSLRTHSNVG